MTRNVRTHMPEGPGSGGYVPEHLTKQQFGARVYELMRRKEWSQSDLARASGLARDAVSTYVRGKSLPGPVSLKKLATALGVSELELLPNHTENAIMADNPSFEMKASPADPGKVWLRVNRLVTMGTAVRVADLLENERAANDAADRD